MAIRREIVILSLSLLCVVNGQQTFQNSQLETSIYGERSQRALFSADQFVLNINQITGANLVDNPAGRQLQADKGAFPFLSTLPNQGSANFITTLKPCGLILPHIHPRATEQYVIIAGQMEAGIAEENGGRQNLTFNVSPGQSLVVPQGLVHYNVNNACTPLVFTQVFNSADPGTIGLTGALTALKNVAPAAINASNLAGVSASPQGGLGLDSACLQRCGFNAQNGGGYNGLSQELQQFIGVASASPSGAPSASAGK